MNADTWGVLLLLDALFAGVSAILIVLLKSTISAADRGECERPITTLFLCVFYTIAAIVAFMDLVASVLFWSTA